MKIDRVETFVCKAGWRPWAFIKISTDEGHVGWADCTDSHGSLKGVLATIDEFSEKIIGRNPMDVQGIWLDLFLGSRQSSSGVVIKSIAAIENALADINGKELSTPVYQLLGGSLRQSVVLYWSHFCTTRVRSPEFLEQDPVTVLTQVEQLINEAKENGFLGLKTNLIMFEPFPRVCMQGFKSGAGSGALTLGKDELKKIEDYLGFIFKHAGTDLEIMLDINSHLRRDSIKKLIRVLDSFELDWLEIDLDDAITLSEIRQSCSMPIASGERLQLMRGYKAFLECSAMDLCVIDVKWNGIFQARRVADLAGVYEVNIVPHNHGSPLATAMSAHLVCATPNCRFLEFDKDDVEWRDEVLTEPLNIDGGELLMNHEPGWGVVVDEKTLHKHRLN